MSDKVDTQVNAIRRLVKRVTGSKTGQVAGRRGPLGRTASVLTRSNQRIGGGRNIDIGRVKRAQKATRRKARRV